MSMKEGLYWLLRKDKKPTVVNVWDEENPYVAFIGTDWDKPIGDVEGEFVGPIEYDE